MNPTQFYISVAVMPVTTIIIVLIGVLPNNKRMDDLRSHMDQGFNSLDRRIEEAKETLRAELRRVEEVVDARLKHLEERDR